MDNSTPSTPARRPIVRVIDALTKVENEFVFTCLEELAQARRLLPDAGLETYDVRLDNIMGLIGVARAEVSDIRQKVLSIARAEAKMKARPEGA